MNMLSVMIVQLIFLGLYMFAGGVGAIGLWREAHCTALFRVVVQVKVSPRWTEIIRHLEPASRELEHDVVYLLRATSGKTGVHRCCIHCQYKSSPL